jgi:hypothetical protein
MFRKKYPEPSHPRREWLRKILSYQLSPPRAIQVPF